MNRLRIRLLATLLLLSLCRFGDAAPNELTPGSAEENAAVAAQTRKVVELIDAGELGAAWDQGAKQFQEATSRLVFIASIRSMRGLVGDVKRRTLQGIGFTHELQDAPPGQYAFAFFETDFANADGVAEKVVFFNQGGQWRLAGYFVKKHVTLSGGSAHRGDST
jgi:hypothetical protein